MGSVLRYLTALAAARFLAPSFPFGTLVVNLAGCFLIGFVHVFAALTARISPEARLFLTTGVMGGLTTYSTFNHETLSLLEGGQGSLAGVYLVATVLGCALAGVLGIASARALIGAV